MRWGLKTGYSCSDWYCRAAHRAVPELASLHTDNAIKRVNESGDLFDKWLAQRQIILARENEKYEAKGGDADWKNNAPGEYADKKTSIQKDIQRNPTHTFSIHGEQI